MIDEVAAREASRRGGIARGDISSGNINGMNVIGVNATAIATGEKGYASVNAAYGKEDVTKLATEHAQLYGYSHKPSLLQSIGHILKSLAGSEDSQTYYGYDGKHIPLPVNVQQGWNKANHIDRGRSGSYTDVGQQVANMPGAHLTRNSRYNGNEVQSELLKNRPGNDPSRYVTGTTFGHHTDVHSFDGTPARDHYVADQIREKYPNLNIKQALTVTQNTIQSFKDGKLVEVQSARGSEPSIADKIRNNR